MSGTIYDVIPVLSDTYFFSSQISGPDAEFPHSPAEPRHVPGCQEHLGLGQSRRFQNKQKSHKTQIGHEVIKRVL